MKGKIFKKANKTPYPHLKTGHNHRKHCQVGSGDGFETGQDRRKQIGRKKIRLDAYVKDSFKGKLNHYSVT